MDFRGEGGQINLLSPRGGWNFSTPAGSPNSISTAFWGDWTFTPARGPYSASTDIWGGSIIFIRGRDLGSASKAHLKDRTPSTSAEGYTHTHMPPQLLKKPENSANTQVTPTIPPKAPEESKLHLQNPHLSLQIPLKIVTRKRLGLAGAGWGGEVCPTLV